MHDHDKAAEARNTMRDHDMTLFNSSLVRYNFKGVIKKQALKLVFALIDNKQIQIFD